MHMEMQLGAESFSQIYEECFNNGASNQVQQPNVFKLLQRSLILKIITDLFLYIERKEQGFKLRKQFLQQRLISLDV